MTPECEDCLILAMIELTPSYEATFSRQDLIRTALEYADDNVE